MTDVFIYLIYKRVGEGVSPAVVSATEGAHPLAGLLQLVLRHGQHQADKPLDAETLPQTTRTLNEIQACTPAHSALELEIISIYCTKQNKWTRTHLAWQTEHGLLVEQPLNEQQIRPYGRELLQENFNLQTSTLCILYGK